MWCLVNLRAYAVCPKSTSPYDFYMKMTRNLPKMNISRTPFNWRKGKKSRTTRSHKHFSLSCHHIQYAPIDRENYMHDEPKMKWNSLELDHSLIDVETFSVRCTCTITQCRYCSLTKYIYVCIYGVRFFFISLVEWETDAKRTKSINEPFAFFFSFFSYILYFSLIWPCMQILTAI